MQLSSILKANRILCAVPCQSKKKIFETISELAEDTDNEIYQANILESLVHREKLGSTGIGNGIAIPHGRIAGLEDVMAIVVTTECGIDFEAIDQKPVDVFFALLVPQEQIEGHLQTLAAVAAKLNDSKIVAGIRCAKQPQDILKLLE